MRHAPFFGLIFLTISIFTTFSLNAAESGDLSSQIEDALKRVGHLKPMDLGQQYELSAGGKLVRGYNDDFLRRRTPQEILDSGLSSGCGDNASSFYYLMERTGAKELYLDAVELSVSSLINRDNGHTGVVVQDPKTAHWILVDPTNQTIISNNWDIHSKIYKDQYWIWYLGPLEDYPPQDHDSLKVLYDKALKSVPQKIWNAKLIRLNFHLDASIWRPDGTLVNPRAQGFIDKYSNIYDKLKLSPMRQVDVNLADTGLEDGEGNCTIYQKNILCPTGRKTAMSPGWFSYIETYAKGVADRFH